MTEWDIRQRADAITEKHGGWQGQDFDIVVVRLARYEKALQEIIEIVEKGPGNYPEIDIDTAYEIARRALREFG